ncbi:DJ-1/PfpI family protein [Deinococcus radiopugnans]|uniref:DJ-1/PfpI family protein n=1 Tax=Deinococcus radiopugnans TaxID=57497 RepID=UPI0014703F4F|nr:DJ-1/PfpI family protein [Deinococcus radiopugnans]
MSYLTAPSLTAPARLHAFFPPPALDPLRPTVAVVLGRDVTEVADALAPYAVFRASGAFNVVTVAETREPVMLTGTLDVLPHYAFAQLDAALGHAPDVIVVPNVPNIHANEALRLWVKRHGQGSSLVLSVCVGAEMVAATGLLDGRAATTHWGDIARIERTYPTVQWVRGQRYVDDGQVISTAGILSGMDGALHVIARLRGRLLARQTAQTPYAARWPGASNTTDWQLPSLHVDQISGPLAGQFRVQEGAWHTARSSSRTRRRRNAYGARGWWVTSRRAHGSSQTRAHRVKG